MTLTTEHLIWIPNRSPCLTFPPLPASPPAPVCAPPAGLPGPLCWTSGSPQDETVCSSGLCSAEVTKRKVVRWFTGKSHERLKNTNWKLMWGWTQSMKMMKRREWNDSADALLQVCRVTLCVLVFPPDRRVCTCLSRAILSHSRSCLLALSCRSSFLICSTCQAESRHCHRYSSTQSDDNLFFRHWVSLSDRNRCGAQWVKTLNNRTVNAQSATVNL